MLRSIINNMRCIIDKDWTSSAAALFHFFFVFVETYHKQTVIFAEDKSGTGKYLSPKNKQIKSGRICPETNQEQSLLNFSFFSFLVAYFSLFFSSSGWYTEFAVELRGMASYGLFIFCALLAQRQSAFGKMLYLPYFHTVRTVWKRRGVNENRSCGSNRYGDQ